MCGRYANLLPADAMVQLFRTEGPVPNWPPRYNIAPTQGAPVCRLDGEGRRRLVLARFGLVPFWAKGVADVRSAFNARAETVAVKPLFREAFARRRCLVPASAFYEWQAGGKVKQPYAVVGADGGPLVLAGLWEQWRDPDSGERLESFAVLTTSANAVMAPLHDRMPVILGKEDWDGWLAGPPEQALERLRPCPDGWLRTYPVDRAVGNVRNDGPGLLDPLLV